MWKGCYQILKQDSWRKKNVMQRLQGENAKSCFAELWEPILPPLQATFNVWNSPMRFNPKKREHLKKGL